MKNISTGFGLCVAATAALAYPFVSNLAPSANASAVTAAASAVSTAATAQTGPTIVWYGCCTLFPDNGLMGITRAWSDGKVELKLVDPQTSGNHYCQPLPNNVPCSGPWFVISSSSEGLSFNADLNFDEAVDGADLGELLAKWGPAPRNPVPPSDCPLALINP
jgi:hypothetical protein